MSFSNYLINILSAFLGALYILYFFKSVFDLRFNTSQTIIFVSSFGLFNGIASSIMSTMAIKPVILFVISIAIIAIVLKTSIIVSFLSFSVYIIILAVGNALTPILLNIFLPGQSVMTMQADPLLSFLGNMFTNMLSFIIFLLIKPVKNFINMVSKDKFLLILTGATVLVLCASSAMHVYTKNFNVSSYIIIASISMSYCIFIVVMWFNALKRVIRDEDVKQQEFYNESLHSTLFELRRFRHDWGNNLTVINSMLKMNKYDELKQYVSELINSCGQHVNTQIYDIRNAGLFGILASKMNHAYEMGVTVDLSVIGEIDSIPGIKISELCEIMGIFLDNAIEEATQGAKSIEISIRNGINCIEISISNSCTTAPDMRSISIDGYSTKGENRGMGLAIAKRIINKYKNILHITTYEDNIFTQTLEIAN